MTPATPEHNRSYLGFDFGERRIGVAIGQDVTATATPLVAVAVRDRRPDWAAIGALIGAWEPAALIVGLPLDVDGGEQHMTGLARRFSRQLAGRFGLPVHLVDERFSTSEARARMRARGDRQDRPDDPVAAAIILESWLARDGPAA